MGTVSPCLLTNMNVKLVILLATSAFANKLNPAEASSFLKSKATDPLAKYSYKQIQEFNQIATALELTSVKAWEDWNDRIEDRAAQGETAIGKQELEKLEECVDACYWADWRADFRGVNFEEEKEK